jgi:phosphatidylinositol-3-phosphatase
MNRGTARLAAIVGVAIVTVAIALAAGRTPSNGATSSPASSATNTLSESPSSLGPTASGAPQSPSTGSVSPSGAPTGNAGIPSFSNVWIIVLENTDYERVVSGNAAPYLQGLIDRFGLAASYSGVARPSQPNYFALFSGSTQGVTDNANHAIDAPNVADQIESAGRTWREYAENVQPGCFTGSSSKGGRDGTGEYRRKHAPAISFNDIRTDPRRCAFIEDLTAFRPGDADYALIIPNQCHSAHDCPLADADQWLAGFVPAILESQAFRDGGVLFVTFDEDHRNDPGGGHVATIVASPYVSAGTRSTTRYDHYSLLRTVEAGWGLDCLAESCQAQPMADIFSAP